MNIMHFNVKLVNYNLFRFRLEVSQIVNIETRPEGLLDPKIRDEMSDFLEIFPTEDQI